MEHGDFGLDRNDGTCPSRTCFSVPLWACIIRLGFRYEDDPSLTLVHDVFASHIDLILRWIQVSTDFCSGESVDLDDRDLLSHSLSMALYMLLRGANIRALILTDTRVYALVVRLWLLCGEHKDKHMRPVAARTFRHCLEVLPQALQVTFKELIANAGFENTASVALYYLRVSSLLPGWDIVNLHLAILSQLDFGFVGIRRILVQQGAVTELVKILRMTLRELSAGERVVDRSLKLCILDMCTAILYRVACSWADIPWMVQLISNGILRDLIQCDPYMKDLSALGNGTILQFFQCLLPDYCIFRSCRRAIQDEYHAMRRDELGTDLSHPPLCKAWETLIKIARTHRGVYRNTRRDLTVRLYQICDGTNVRNVHLFDIRLPFQCPYIFL